MKKSCSILLLLCFFVSLFSACSGNNSVHPKGFDKYYALLGKHTEPILDELGIKEEELTKLFHRYYATETTVTYHDIPFAVNLYTDETRTLLAGVEYVASFSETNKETTEAIYNLLQQMTKDLEEIQAGSYFPNPQHLAQLTIEELEERLTGNEDKTYSDHWVLDPVKTEEANAYKSYLIELDKKIGKPMSSTFYQDYPVLLLDMKIHNDGNGNVTVRLSYGLSFF